LPTIIYSSSYTPRTIEKSAFTQNVTINTPPILEQPLYSDYYNEVLDLINSISVRDFDFQNEMHEIENMIFSLLEYPEESVADFNVLYARVQSYLTRCSSILIEINREKSEWQSLKSKAERIYKRVQNIVYVTDAVCKTLKNQALQQAYAEEKMPSLVRVLDIINSIIPDLKLLGDRVEIKLSDLDRANTNLNRQQKITEDLIALNHPVGTLRTLSVKR
jgi:DNA repair ATPase RecN